MTQLAQNITDIHPKRESTGQNGQILLVVLLITLVGLTIGLGVASRTSQDVAISTRLEESSQAFAAAEAGLELAYSGEITGSVSDQTLTPTSSYDIAINQLGDSDDIYPADPREIAEGDILTIWLVDHDSDERPIETPMYTANTIAVCWNESTPVPGEAAVTPAMEVTVAYKSGSDYRMVSAAYDPDGGRRRENDFEPAAPGPGRCTGFDFWRSVNFSNLGIDPRSDTLLALRITPVYATTHVGVRAANNETLPRQGVEVIATGNAGLATRKIRVTDPFRVPTSFLDRVLFSTGGGVEKEEEPSP